MVSCESRLGRHPRIGRGLIWAVGIVALCAALFGGTLYVLPNIVRYYFWDAKQELCMNDAYYSLLAHGAEGGPIPRDKLDSTGKPILSWRRICADGDAGPRLGDPNAPWNAPANRLAAGGGCLTFCLFQPPQLFWRLFRDYPETRVLAVAGPDTAFDRDRKTSLRYLPPNLILLVEVWDTGINWLEPGDIDVRDYRHLRMGGQRGRGCWVLFADGILVFLRSDVPLENVKRFCTITSAKQSVREELLRPYIVEVRDCKREGKEYYFQGPLIP